MELTFENLGPLFLLSRSRILPLMLFLYEAVWVLDLLGSEDRKDLNTEALPLEGIVGSSRV